MAFMSNSGILERILRFHSLRWDKGQLSLWNIPGFFYAAYVTVYQQRLMEKLYGKKAASDFFYNVGRFQGIQGFRTVARHFGFAKIIRDRKRLLEMQIKQSNFVGFGDFKWVRIDFENKLFVARGKSTLAEEYRRFFGLQKKPVCHLLRGIGAGYLEELIREPVLSIEKACVAAGKPFCELVIRPNEDWTFSDSTTKFQAVTKFFDISSLGAVREPFMRTP